MARGKNIMDTAETIMKVSICIVLLVAGICQFYVAEGKDKISWFIFVVLIFFFTMFVVPLPVKRCVLEEW